VTRIFWEWPALNASLFYREAHPRAAERVKLIDHEGREVLIIDFSRAELEMVRAVAAEALHVMQQRPAQSVLSLVEVEGIPFSTDALQIGGELTDRVQPFALRTAVNGVTGFRGFMLQTIADAARRPIKLFKDRPSALEWLILGDDSE